MSTGFTDQSTNTPIDSPQTKESGADTTLTSKAGFFSRNKNENGPRYPYFDALAKVSRLGS